MEQSKLSDVSCVRKWGGSASDAVLDSTSTIFRTPGCDGIIGYRAENRCAIVFGDPVCPENQRQVLVEAFHDFCALKSLKIVYLVVSESFAEWLLQHGYCKSMIEYGEEFVLDPNEDPRKKTGPQARLVRRKTGHAINDGVTIKEYIPFDERIEQGIREVGEKWLNGRTGPQIYIANVTPLDNPTGKRWLYAEKDGQIIGTIVLSRLEKEQGWLFNHLMFVKDAPAGVPELLVVTGLEIVSAEGCKHVNFGTVPLSQLGKISGLNGVSKFLAMNFYHMANKLYRLNGKKTFWEKFDPLSKKEFIIFKNSRISLREALALKKALNATLK